MPRQTDDKRAPNRVFMVMVAISLGIHFVIFLYIADLYHSENYRYIEVSVTENNELDRRAIPQPRVRHKPPEVHEVDKIDVSKHKVPKMKPAPVDAGTPDVAMEEIGMPDTSGLSADVSEWQPPASAQYVSQSEYFDMLRLKIESHKEYPESARSRQIQGRVVVGFTIGSDGKLSSVNVVKSSRHDSLDRAALQAVRQSAPFAPPPESLFSSGALQMKITILFELT